MSHSSGTVTFSSDGAIFHCEYDGTSDYMVSDIYPTHDEMSANWRNGDRKECTCGKLEPVKIYAAYGSGFEWYGEACRECLAINHDHLREDWKEEEDYKKRQAEDYKRWGFTWQ